MTVVVALAAMALAAVAAAGVAHPFGRYRVSDLEPADPLEDERAGLLRALRDLDREHASGLISDQDYRGLRDETENRAVAVLRALEAREGAGELGAGLREVRPRPAPVGAKRRSRRTAFVAVGGVALMAVVATVLAGAVRLRSSDQPITGTAVGAQDTLAFFQERVRAHPKDLAARLDLADAYLREANVEGAIAQYLTALSIDRQNPEARATLGFLLYKAGKPQEGLAQVEAALRVAPNDPESLYFKGVILLKGLDRPAEAATAFQAYLTAARFGARRAEVQQLLREAQEGANAPE